MKHIILLTASVLAFNLPLATHAQPLAGGMKSGEALFIEHADHCLEIMVQAAGKISVTGVAMVAYVPGDKTGSWISKMKVVGVLANDEANFLGIANAKASEMVRTYRDSGTSGQEPLTGEFGWQGGMIRKVGSGYLLAAFSGGTGEQDAEISDRALEWLSGYY